MELKHLPHTPGVYLMRDSQAKLIYIGKAKDLSKRVASYFQNRILSEKVAALKQCVLEIDYIPTHSERESLLLEQKLIHKFKPFFNTLWRDDKTYPYLKLTLNEDVPRIFLTRNVQKDGASYFGPYPNVSVVKKLLRTFWRKKLFPLRPCRFPFHSQDLSLPGGLEKSQPKLFKRVQSCIYLQTGECPAPCVGKIALSDYRKIAEKLKLFLLGKFQPLKKNLERNMKKAAKELDFEKAAELRNQLSALAHISEKVRLQEVNEESLTGEVEISRALTELQDALCLPRPPIRIEAFDVSNIGGTEAVGSLVVFENGRPLKSDYRKFKIKTVAGPDDFAMIHELVTRRYRRVWKEGKKLPDLILIDGGKGQLSSAIKGTGYFFREKVACPCVALAKKNEEIFLPDRSEPVRLAKDSPALQILQRIRDEAHRFAVTFHRRRREKALFR